MSTCPLAAAKIMSHRLSGHPADNAQVTMLTDTATADNGVRVGKMTRCRCRISRQRLHTRHSRKKRRGSTKSKTASSISGGRAKVWSAGGAIPPAALRPAAIIFGVMRPGGIFLAGKNSRAGNFQTLLLEIFPREKIPEAADLEFPREEILDPAAPQRTDITRTLSKSRAPPHVQSNLRANSCSKRLISCR